MRILEVALIVVNILSLFPGIRHPSKQAWLGIAGVNLLLLLAHGTVEGWRYQMAFSYLFVGLLVLYALAKMSDRFRAVRIPTLFKGGAVALLLGSALLAYTLPVFSLPTPTGEFVVGVEYLHLVDESRTDPFLDPSLHNRELMAKIYYPAIADDSKPYVPYFHGSLPLIRLFTAHYGLPYGAFDHLLLVQSHAKAGLAMAEAQPQYPVVLVSHGAGNSMEVQSAQSEDLASHGYIVVVIDHTYASMGTEFSDRIVSGREATTNFDTPEPAAPITQIMAEDAQFVLDKLAEINANGTLPLLQGRLNLDAVGALGHSVGGAVAYNLALNDSRIKAAMNVDGAVYITPTVALDAIPPVLMLANDRYSLQAVEARTPLLQPFDGMSAEDKDFTRAVYGSEAAYQTLYATAQANMAGLADVLATSDGLFTITGSDHMKFVDIGMFIGVPQVRELLNIRGDTDPARCLEITNALTVAFFNQYLKGASTTDWEALHQRYPELLHVGL